MSTNSPVLASVSPPPAGDPPSIPAPAGESDDSLLTVRDVARRLRLHDSTVQRWARSGQIDAIKLPSKGGRFAYLIRTSTLNGLIKPQSMTQAPQL